MPEQSRLVILYDGVCGLCNRLNQFVLKRDHHDSFRFASLQSEFAANVLKRHGCNPNDLDTLYVIVGQGEPSQHLLSKSNAAIAILRRIGGVWAMAAGLKILPAFLRDKAYDVVAHHRYRIFGKLDACLIPEQRDRAKFIEI